MSWTFYYMSMLSIYLTTRLDWFRISLLIFDLKMLRALCATMSMIDWGFFRTEAVGCDWQNRQCHILLDIKELPDRDLQRYIQEVTPSDIHYLYLSALLTSMAGLLSKRTAGSSQIRSYKDTYLFVKWTYYVPLREQLAVAFAIQTACRVLAGSVSRCYQTPRLRVERPQEDSILVRLIYDTRTKISVECPLRLDLYVASGVELASVY